MRRTFAHTGVPIGFDLPIPRTPAVFREKTKFRSLDESDFDPVRDNYSSADLSAEQLRAKFRDEEELGSMFPTALGRLVQEHGESRVRVASMGAVMKPDGSARPVHDGTHGVHVNNSIRIGDQLELPGPPELAAVARAVAEQRAGAFSVAADVKAAHRLVKVRPADWPLLACRAESSDKVVWVNRVGTFGISSASLWRSRLFGGVGRLIGACLLLAPFWQLVFVDDVRGVFVGRRKFVLFWVWLVV